MDFTLRNFPEGFVTRLYQFYIGRDGKKLDFVGKQENSADDLVEALNRSGTQFNERLLREMPKVNVSPKKVKPKMPKDLRERVLEAEKWVISNYY
jgi:hypothetical protein